MGGKKTAALRDTVTCWRGKPSPSPRVYIKIRVVYRGFPVCVTQQAKAQSFRRWSHSKWKWNGNKCSQFYLCATAWWAPTTVRRASNPQRPEETHTHTSCGSFRGKPSFWIGARAAVLVYYKSPFHAPVYQLALPGDEMEMSCRLQPNGITRKKKKKKHRGTHYVRLLSTFLFRSLEWVIESLHGSMLPVGSAWFIPKCHHFPLAALRAAKAKYSSLLVMLICNNFLLAQK